MKTPEEIKNGLQRCFVTYKCDKGCPYVSDCCDYVFTNTSIGADALAYIEKLEEQIQLMKIQMHGDCGVCKHRHNSKKRKDGPSFIGPCQTCVHDESRPNWEYEGLPEVKGR